MILRDDADLEAMPTGKFTEMLIVAVVDPAGLAAVMTKSVGHPKTVGVPVMMPVVAFNVNPPGSAGFME